MADDLVTRLRSGARTFAELNRAALEAADEIARLTAALAEAEAERDGLAVALLPFAEHAEHVEVWCLTNAANVHVVTENGTGAVLSRVTLGDFRRARAALARPAAQPEP